MGNLSNLTIEKEKYILGISINVLLMGFVSFFTDISSEMITTVLPFYVLAINGTALSLGFINGLSNAVSNIIKGISGWLSDKFKQRKAFVLAGYSISNIAKPFIGVQNDWRFIMGLKITDRIGKGIRVAPRDALISYYAEKSAIEHPELGPRSGLNFGIHRTMDTLGATVAPFIVMLLLFFNKTYSQIIIFSIFPGLIAIIILIFVKDVKEDKILELKEQLKLKKEVGSSGKDNNKSSVKPEKEKMSKNLKNLLIILSFMEFASVDIAFIMIRATFMINELWIPLLYGLLNLIYAIFATPAGKLEDKFGKQKVITIGLLILLGISFVLIFRWNLSTLSIGIILTCFLAFGIYNAIVETGAKAFISDITGKNKKGKIYGLYNLSVGLLSIPESLIFAYLYDTFGYSTAFSFSSIVLLICIIIFSKTDFSKL